MELIRSSISIDCGLPCEKVRSAPAIVFSRPAQRSLTLRPARSPSRQATLYTEGSDSFVASTAASIATGWSEPVPGRESHPLKSSAFHGALFQQLRKRPAGFIAFCDASYRATKITVATNPSEMSTMKTYGFLATASTLVRSSRTSSTFGEFRPSVIRSRQIGAVSVPRAASKTASISCGSPTSLCVSCPNDESAGSICRGCECCLAFLQCDLFVRGRSVLQPGDRKLSTACPSPTTSGRFTKSTYAPSAAQNKPRDGGIVWTATSPGTKGSILSSLAK